MGINRGAQISHGAKITTTYKGYQIEDGGTVLYVTKERNSVSAGRATTKYSVSSGTGIVGNFEEFKSKVPSHKMRQAMTMFVKTGKCNIGNLD